MEKNFHNHGYESFSFKNSQYLTTQSANNNRSFAKLNQIYQNWQNFKFQFEN